MKIIEISYTETRKGLGAEKFSSKMQSFTAKASISDEDNKDKAVEYLKEFVRAQFK